MIVSGLEMIKEEFLFSGAFSDHMLERKKSFSVSICIVVYLFNWQLFKLHCNKNAIESRES